MSATGTHVLVWTLANGQRQANPMPRDWDIAHSLANLMNREQGGTVYAALPLEDLQTWKEQPMNSVTADVPVEEMMTNADGDPIPARLVPGRIKLEDQTVNILIQRATAMQKEMADFKANAFSDVYAYLAELSASYGANRAGKRGGVELNSYDGLRRVSISVADSVAFGPELVAAKELIDTCIRRWGADAKPELMALINNSFRVGAGGKIRVDRVLELRRLSIDDADWKMAMVAIGDALRVQGSVAYIRFYQRERQDLAWQNIALDMSRL